MSTTYDYDVLVIGGGPAGATAACRVRQAGLKTLVVERAGFPRFHIGESLLPNCNALLREIGVWPKIERAGFIDKFGASFHLSNGAADKEVIFANGRIPGLDRTYQVERSRFDAILLDHAAESGVEVRTGATVRAVAADSAGHRVSIETGSATHTVTARWIIDAAGRDRLVSGGPGFPLDPARLPKRVALYNHFRRVRRPEGIAAGHTVIVRLPDGWFWLIPIDAERTSVGLVTTVDALRRARAAPAEVFRRAVAGSPRLRELMAGAEPVTDEFHVTSDYGYFRASLASGRTLLVGDAAGFTDPVFSSGVYMALYSARHAAGLIARAHRRGRALTETQCRRYTRRVKKHADVFQRLIDVFYDNDSFSVFMTQNPPFTLGPALTSIVAGHARLTWPIFWRYHLFLFICRLQRRFRLLPLIDFTGMDSVAPPSSPSP